MSGGRILLRIFSHGKSRVSERFYWVIKRKRIRFFIDFSIVQFCSDQKQTKNWSNFRCKNSIQWRRFQNNVRCSKYSFAWTCSGRNSCQSRSTHISRNKNSIFPFSTNFQGSSSIDLYEWCAYNHRSSYWTNAKVFYRLFSWTPRKLRCLF